MNVNGPVGATFALCWFLGLLGLLTPELALAADPEWRPTYDLAMRWINFIILVAVIVKFAKDPIKDFLKLQKQDVVSQIDSLDSEKSRILEEIEAAKQKTAENQIRLQELKERLISQGETRKEQIIQQAHQQSKIMLEEAKRKMENQIVQAKAELKIELLDMAMGKAVERLPELMTDEDSQRMVDDYMVGIQT
jgi:F-type H+-transporting ATPase subunit b